MKKFRLILDEARPAALNMAVDELLMGSSAAEGPVLRFYRWSSPAVTLGYFEDVTKAARLFKCREKKMPAVRRITGGGAVLHGQDLTFSLSMRVPAPFFGADVKSSYLKINEAVRMGLRDRFPSIDYADCKTVPVSQSTRQRGRVCFDAPSCYDLLLEGKKILGGSQRRTRGVMLHQSTLFLSGTAALAADIVKGFESVWKVQFEMRPLDERELDAARAIERKKSADPAWAYFPEASPLREEIFLS